MLKRCVGLVMVIVLLSVPLSSYAEVGTNNPGQLRYNYTASVYAGLSISGTMASCYGNAHGLQAGTTTHIRVTLQKRPNGSSTWDYLASWSATASGMASASVNETYSVSVGNSYRVRVRCQIKDSDGNVLETVYCYSDVWSI